MSLEIEILKAVSGMMDITDEKEIPIIKVRINCARGILDGVIKAMEAPSLVEEVRTILKKPPVPRIEVEPVESTNPNDKYKIVVKDGVLLKVEGLPLDAMMEVDGIKMTHRNAIGKHFTEGRIL